MVCCMLTRGFQPQVPLKAPRRYPAAGLVQGGKVRVRHRHLQHRKTRAARCWVVVVCYMVFDTCIAGGKKRISAASAAQGSTPKPGSSTSAKGQGRGSSPSSGEVLGGGGMLHGV